MGDMADMVMDMMFDDYCDNFDHDPIPYSQTCEYCGKRNLEWLKTDRGWRMFTADGKAHSCQQYRDAHQRPIEWPEDKCVKNSSTSTGDSLD